MKNNYFYEQVYPNNLGVQFFRTLQYTMYDFLKCQSQQLSSALSSACDFKSHFCKQCGPRSDCSFRNSLIWVHTVCWYAKNSFEKFARIFSRRHKQTTFSDAFFLGTLRVKHHPQMQKQVLAYRFIFYFPTRLS